MSVPVKTTQKPPQVFVYLDERDKATAQDVARRLRTSESRLFRALALPQLYAVAKMLNQGAKPFAVKAKIMERLEEIEFAEHRGRLEQK